MVCTSYTSLPPSCRSVHTSQRPVRTSQIQLSVRTSHRSVCNSQTSTLLRYQFVRTSQRSACASHLSLSPSEIKNWCALLKYLCAVLNTLTSHFFSIALRTSEVSHWTLLKYHWTLHKFLPHFSGYENYFKTRNNPLNTGTVKIDRHKFCDF